MNTGAAEVLYSAVGEWAQLDQDSTVLDVCCGTGTIGISLAKVTSQNHHFVNCKHCKSLDLFMFFYWLTFFFLITFSE